MTVLDRLIDELRTERGPIRSSDLARRIGVSEPALGGMIDVLTAKGVLSARSDSAEGEAIACSGVACGTTCVGLDACPFIANVPDTYTLIVEPTLGSGVAE
ncbi:MAG: FeoC-like transcriptional regulator [Actinomycetota bacterium]|nr:FeoC-like transcriptional regulator [Actinomycetota bacterium]